MIRRIKMALTLALALGFISGCAIIRDNKRQYHEGHSTVEEFAVAIDKMPTAVNAFITKNGFKVTDTQNSAIDGKYEAEGANDSYLVISFKKIEDAKTKVYLRVGAAGDKDKEKVLMADLKKELVGK